MISSTRMSPEAGGGAASKPDADGPPSVASNPVRQALRGTDLKRFNRSVRRDARGAIHVTRVTEDRVELSHLGPRTPASRPSRRA